MPTTIKKGHVESLSKHTIPVPRVEEYRRLKWTIVETDTPIILGDVGCIFKVDGEDSFKPTCEVDKVSQIYLPISSYKILVGTNGVEIELDIGVLKERDS